MKKVSIIFFGTPEFSATILKSILKSHPAPYQIVAVVTQPDRPKGRRQILTPSPVKILAKKHKIPLLTPKALNGEFISQLKTYNFQLGLLSAYGKIIPKKLLKIPKYGFLNIHPSLLPRHRGPSPIEYAILKGDRQTGVTIIKMDEKIDHGPIISQAKIKIDKTDTKAVLGKKLAQLATSLLLATLPPYLAYKRGQSADKIGDDRRQFCPIFLPPKPQDHQKATFTKILTRQDGFIPKKDLKKALLGSSAKLTAQVERKIRAFDPWPGTWTILQISYDRSKIVKAKPTPKRLKRLKLLKAHLEKEKLVLDLVQLEGKKPVSFGEFKRAYPQLNLS